LLDKIILIVLVWLFNGVIFLFIFYWKTK